jgi:YaiO family outer membrane protein
MNRHSIAGFALLLALSFTSAQAQADGQATATATTTAYSFSGNQNYGPWTVQSLEYRFQLPADVPAITLVDRNDNDRPISTGSRAVYLDDYHTFSSRFYAYAQVGTADGTLLPYRSVYLEGDAKFGRRGALVIAAGGAVLQNAGGTTTRYASIGPTLYSGQMAFTVRFMPADTNGAGTSATQFSAQYNRAGRDQIALVLLDGTQPNVLAGLPANLAGFQRVQQATLTIKHWINHDSGFVVGGTLANFADARSAANSYRQRGVTFGVFIVPH